MLGQSLEVDDTYLTIIIHPNTPPAMAAITGTEAELPVRKINNNNNNNNNPGQEYGMV